MKRTVIAAIVPLVILAVFAAIPVLAQAETEVKTLVSEESNSFCVNPTKGFVPVKKGKLNFGPLEKAHKGAFPDTGKACAPETATHPTPMAGPGAPAFPYSSSITGASWVSLNATGEDASNPAPKYYIYDATFTLCPNQLRTAEINGEYFADNTGAVFMNGVFLKKQATGLPATNHENFFGTPTPFTGVGAPGGLNAGLNTLQFVVLDETAPYTALDFRALVTAVPCAVQWYSNGHLLEEGQVEEVTTSGVLSSRIGEAIVKCKVRDHENIVNPVGGGDGVDEMTEYVATGCSEKPSPCPGKTPLEVIARNLPWTTHLVPGPPVRDVIEGVAIESRCGGVPLDLFAGTLMPVVGKSVLEFGSGSGELEDPAGNKSTTGGKDKLIGPPGDEKITAG